MATTTPTSSTSSLSTIMSTLASSPSPTPTSDDPGGVESSSGDVYIFTGNGSPPLIVAFVAIGLFIIAMGVVFAWRRMAQSRGLLVQPVRTTIRSRKKRSFLGEKPILWDIWTHQGGENTRTAVANWETLMPLSAVLHSPSVEASAVPTSTALKPVIIPRRHAFGALPVDAVLRRFRPPVSPPSFLSSPPPPPPLLPVSNEKMDVPNPKSPPDKLDWEEGSSLQISMTIAMPSPKKPVRDDSSWEGGNELGEFCIGTMEVPWRDC